MFRAHCLGYAETDQDKAADKEEEDHRLLFFDALEAKERDLRVQQITTQ